MAKFKKGHQKILGSGARKGVPRKFTQEIKDMVRLALQEAGGVDYLVRQAEANPAAFLSLVAKILPKEITATVQSMPSRTEVDSMLKSVGLDPAIVWAGLH